MSNLNLRSKVEPSVFTELRTIWTSRCLQVTSRKESEKTIDTINKQIINKMNDSLKNRIYLKNARLYIKDTYMTLEKFYSLRNNGTNQLFNFSLCTNMPSIATFFLSDKSAKSIPKIIEKSARYLDNLVKKTTRNHTINQTGISFKVILDTQTKYSF